MDLHSSSTLRSNLKDSKSQHVVKTSRYAKPGHSPTAGHATPALNDLQRSLDLFSTARMSKRHLLQLAIKAADEAEARAKYAPSIPHDVRIQLLNAVCLNSSPMLILDDGIDLGQ
eukprot:9614555-Karenia_brevis.AAC.1